MRRSRLEWLFRLLARASATVAPVFHNCPPIRDPDRTRRSERTRQRIINAVTQLVDEGNLHLRTAEIAERAEVSVRSIFRHFPDLEALYLSVADAQLRGILADLQPVRTEGNLDERVSALVSERTKVGTLCFM
jgi:AcrR family transcriptional regulator